MGHSRRFSLVLAVVVPALMPPPITGQGTDSAIVNALMAQVEGLGGCTDLGHVRQTKSRFFPQVELFEGLCLLEHGDTARPLVARDSAGLIYVLDSPSSFRFLIRQHHPVGLDSTAAVPYAHQALVMMGKMAPEARLAANPGEVPSKLCHDTGFVCSGLFRTHAEDNGRTVFLTAFTESSIFSAGPVLLELSTGFVSFAGVQERWKGGSRIR